MLPASPSPNPNSVAPYDLMDEFVLLEPTQPLATPAPQSNLIEYENRMLVNRIADRVFAMTNTGTRCVEGYRNPDRLATLLDNPDEVPNYLFKTLVWMVNYQGFQLKSQHLDHYLKYLTLTVTKKFEIIFQTLILKADTGHTPAYYLNLWLLEFQQTKAEKPDFLFIPFVYKANYFAYAFLPHIVMIEVNFKDNAIYYYDSQGLTTEHYCRQVYEEFNMTVELEKLKEKAFGSNSAAKIICSRYVHQQDCHNCGVYCCDYIERRLMGERFEHIDTNGKGAAAIEETRLAQALKMTKSDPNPGEF